eukprot:jgi/Mesvir1/3120/Mv05560-RA.1
MAAAKFTCPVAGKVVVPGDVALDLTSVEGGVVSLGGGLRQSGDSVVCTKTGVLLQDKNRIWCQGSQKRFIAAPKDAVLGIIVEKHGENYAVDIKGASLAVLPGLAFEGATRRNRPNLKVGDLLYCRVDPTSTVELETTLTCMDDNGKASGFGPLEGGYSFNCTTALARMLLSKPTCPLLDELGKHVPFELAVGINGRIWVKADNVMSTVKASHLIANAEFLSGMQQRIMVKKVMAATG